MTTVIVDTKDKIFYCDTRVSTSNYKTRLLGLGKKFSHYTYEDNFIKIWTRQHVEFTGSGYVEDIEKHVSKYGEANPKIKRHNLAAYCTRSGVFTFHGHWRSVGGRYKVSGSGSGVACQRLWANMSPIDAIKSTSRQDPYTSDKIVVHVLKNKLGDNL